MGYNDFIEKRKKLLNEEEISLTDHWQLYTGVYNLARSLNNIELIKDSIKIPGDILEFGCWKGSNLMLMAKTLEIFAPMTHKKIYGFDLFEGLDFFDKKDGDSKSLKGDYKGDEQKLRDIIDLFDFNDKVNLVKGNILETVPKFIEKNDFKRYSLIYIDTDLYKTTKLILESFSERLVKGGVFVLDEWNSDTFPGETIAVTEFLNTNKNFDLITVEKSLQPTLILKKK